MDNNHKSEPFHNRHVLERYYQDDVTVLRQACRVFRRELMQICNIEVILESITIASACNSLFWNRFINPDTIGLIPAGGYSGIVSYSKKALTWLVDMEHVDAVKINHARNCLEWRLPELPHYSVDD